MKNNRLFHTLIILLAFFATCLAIAFGTHFRAGLELTIGYPAEMRIRVPEDSYVEDFAATEANRQEALRIAEGIVPIISADPDTWAVAEHNLGLLREEFIDIREEYRQERHDYEAALLQWETDRVQAIAADAHQDELPPQPERPQFEGASFERFERMAMPIMPFSDIAQQQYVVEMSDDDFHVMWTAIFTVAEYVQTRIVISEIDFSTQLAVSAKVRTLQGFDRLSESIIENIVLNRLRPNAIPDEELNNLLFERAANNYERVILHAGQIIVDENEIVTQNIYDIATYLNLLRTENLMDNLFPMLGVFAVVAALFLACIIYLSFYLPGMKINKKESMLLITLYMLTLGLMWALSEIPFPFFPLFIFSMLTAILIDRRAAAMLTFAMVFICYFVVQGNLSFLFFYSISGLLICLLSRYTTERSKVFLVGIVITAIQFALSIAITFIEGYTGVLQDMLIAAVFAGLSGFLTVIICTGSLPLWETFFGVVTPVKLLDLTNPTNVLLRRLTIEAPGTYHHSLIVANLAEAAAYDIGANAHAARVGGYYHDVGKLKFPHYFAENIDGDNPHDHLDPINSVQLIISHVSHGLTLASEHRLPQFVRDIIKEHHGTTVLQFFYSKARERDINVNEKDYRYPYTIPQTRESACVMLADSVEAAARVIIPKLDSVDEVEDTIRNIVRAKLNDGQLAESQLSIKDVAVIEQSFCRVLKGMYHERIAYPKAPEPSEDEI